MKGIFLLLFVFSFLFFTGCGGNNEEEKIDVYDIENLVEKGEKINKDINDAEKKLEERRKKGDTIVVPWEKLNEIIPSIEGYVRSEPQGMLLTFDNQSYSSATATFKKNNSEIEISLYDYNAVVSLFTSVTAWKSIGLSVESSDGYQKVNKFDIIKDSWIYEEYNKSGKRAVASVSLNDRFWLQVAADDQENTEFVKQIAKDVANNGKSLFNK